MTDHQDKKYINALQNSDNQGISKIYQDFSNGISNWVIQNSGTIQDAEDIFNEAIIVIFERVKRTDFELKYSFEKWLFGICRNKWMNHLKKNKRDKEVINDLKGGLSIESDMQSQIEEMEEKNQRQQNLDIAFEQLSDLCKQLLLLAKEGKSAIEITAKLKMNKTSTVHHRKSECIKRWRTLFKKLH